MLTLLRVDAVAHSYVEPGWLKPMAGRGVLLECHRHGNSLPEPNRFTGCLLDHTNGAFDQMATVDLPAGFVLCRVRTGAPFRMSSLSPVVPTPQRGEGRTVESGDIYVSNINIHGGHIPVS